MDSSLIARIRELIHQGDKLIPEGGLEFSGYNAKMQSQYLLWRKNCLEALGKCGDKGSMLRSQVANDENGAYFYQTSAQKVSDALKDALKIAEALPPTPPPPPPEPSPAKPAAEVEHPHTAEPSKPSAKVSSPATNRVYIVSAANNPLLPQLTAFLKELGIDTAVYQRTGGGSDALLSSFEKQPAMHYAFYLAAPDDVPSAMFEMGFLVGKMGSSHVCCIYPKDSPVPKTIPGVQKKEIVVKLEEISFSLIKELKAAGYSVSI
ncbi:MAG TPA: TIR domain-containing protein [Bacteroidota bacterium]|nr:TIR domain-containing protein [Bacteroidota bacterium]